MLVYDKIKSMIELIGWYFDKVYFFVDKEYWYVILLFKFEFISFICD